MKRPAAIAATAALFLTGIVVGVLATHLFYARLLERPGGPPRIGGRFYASLLERRLDLAPEQKVAIDEILERNRERSIALRRQLRPQVRELMERTQREIEAVLTEEQRAEFIRLREVHRRRTEQFLLGPPGPRHRRPGGRPPRGHRGPPPG